MPVKYDSEAKSVKKVENMNETNPWVVKIDYVNSLDKRNIKSQNRGKREVDLKDLATKKVKIKVINLKNESDLDLNDPVKDLIGVNLTINHAVYKLPFSSSFGAVKKSRMVSFWDWIFSEASFTLTKPIFSNKRNRRDFAMFSDYIYQAMFEESMKESGILLQ